EHHVDGVRGRRPSAGTLGLRITAVSDIASGALGETASFVRRDGPVNAELKPPLPARLVAVAEAVADEAAGQSAGDETPDLGVSDDGATFETVDDALADLRHVLLQHFSSVTPSQAALFKHL